MHREMTHILVDHGSKIEEPEVDGVKPVSIEPALSKIQEVLFTACFLSNKMIPSFTKDLTRNGFKLL